MSETAGICVHIGSTEKKMNVVDSLGLSCVCMCVVVRGVCVRAHECGHKLQCGEACERQSGTQIRFNMSTNTLAM